MKNTNNQKGFTIIELMVGLAIGLVLLTGAASIFQSIFSANVNAVKQQRFEQAMQALLAITTSDIRRAGYVNVGQIANPANPVVLTNQSNGSHYYSSGSGCVLFSHSTPTADEIFYGYKLINKIVYQYIGATNGDCTTNVTNWVALTDVSYIVVNTLSFANSPAVTVTIGATAVGLNTTNSTGSAVAVSRVISAIVTMRNV